MSFQRNHSDDSLENLKTHFHSVKCEILAVYYTKSEFWSVSHNKEEHNNSY